MATQSTHIPAGEGEEAKVPRVNWGWFVIRGLLAVGLGIMSLIFPFKALFAFTMAFAFYSFVDGIASLISGIRGARRSEERWWTLVLRGIVGIIVAAIFIATPGLATVASAFTALGILAAWSIFTGIFEILAAIRLRKVIRGEWLLMISGAVSIFLGAIVVMIMANPLSTMLSAGWAIGAYALVAGFALIGQGLRLRRAQPGLA